MPRYSIYVNKEQDKLLIDYGKLLVKEKFIEEPAKPYKILKFILNRLTKTLKEKNVLETPSKIIDNKTPIEKEQTEQIQTDEKDIERTETHETYKKIR